ncbi:MAG: tRNA epoxyqueuosine(34) reductase QueG [Methylobacteriaceae bacterium]|jgi:epoxyqueuosine reductase|nr:tRNA epoxyqueuosine(34) reductase QueG [Methylobacteriaceae bacterium]
MDPHALKRLLQEKARSLGFADLRAADITTLPDSRPALEAWLAAGCHGSMEFMARRAELRGSPAALWPEAKTALVAALAFKPPPETADKTRAAIASYATRRDYHDVLTAKLRDLAALLRDLDGGEAKLFVDTGPVMEKPLAQHAGIGWRGRHGLVMSRRFGPWLHLGVILTTADIPPDEPETDHCGRCRLCLDACPTGALTAPYRLDPRRCIAYYTTEHKGMSPEELRPGFGNRVFGCDACVAVCPWNKFAAPCPAAEFAPRPDLAAPTLADLLALDDAAFRALFNGTPVRRIGRARFIRNTLIAAGNSGDPNLIPAVAALLHDPAPEVGRTAEWALEKLKREVDGG